jgi:RNA polymerase sigma-70 factor (ECF subfamily)
VPSQRPPLTRLTLLGAIAQGLRWDEFLAIYGRIILHWAVRDFGLQEFDAEDLRQEVLIRVWKGIPGYDPNKGRFRSWLYSCTKNAVANLRRRVRGRPMAPLTDGLGCRRLTTSLEERCWPHGEDASLDQILLDFQDQGFEPAELQAAVRQVQSRIQARTWKAFLLFEFFEMSAKEIAPLVQLTPAAVNQAVHRVRRLLQEAFPAGNPNEPSTSEPGP